MDAHHHSPLALMAVLKLTMGAAVLFVAALPAVLH
ncbi:MAG: hypothetical protein JWM71_2173 [Solirubrobacteraceae bacterium]|nr:hypothetical protein [Solirubrobacteraceae bacterium]